MADADEMLKVLRRWVEIETPSGEPERVRALAALVASEFERVGSQAHLHPAALELEFGGGGGLLLLGHLDTVYPLGTLARTPWRGEGDRVYAPGIFDMKGGVAAALFALRDLKPVPPLRLLLNFDEEIGSPGSRALIEERARGARAALVLEPAAAGGALKTARKGIARYTLRAHGVPAHSGVDFEKGASAVAELAARVAEVSAWSDPAAGLTVNVGMFHGGSAANVVAAEAEAEVEVRAWETAALAVADRRLRGLASAHPRVRLELEGGINRPPMEETTASRSLFHTAQRLGRAHGLELTATRTGGGSDGNFTAALGVPTLDGLGMVGGGAHTPQEHILLSQLPLRTALLADLISAL